MAFIITLFFALPVWAVNLDQAVQSTLQKNETVGQSRQQLKQAEEQKQQAKSAIYPNLSLNGTYLVQPESTDSIAAELFPQYQTTANLT
ncbi:MAG: TolC family protein, partial [Pseudobdellovibrionaceae bacterium]